MVLCDLVMRSFREKDTEQLVFLILDFEKEENKRTHVESSQMESFLRDIHSGKNTWAVVLDNRNCLQGYGVVHRYSNNADPFRKKGVFEVQEFYIAREVRGMGLGTRIVGGTLQKIRLLQPERMRQVITEIRDENSKSISIPTKRYRFQPYNPRVGYDNPNYTIYGRFI